ncbi:predicted protein [Histoplasma capsulatum G186AR]|uniref:Uncharacterized protein n=1 Tax=Ajellomyces capsulatus (strain G186AR / H82 / ATCC MYA-2454 / RMSCC 2432) TaxID=447093 RepID=C0NVV4_AJECG|nr:uncharacterized protein HCBG_07284 [Histoplasma capsulatum G186AR]EEH04643.1 predicted protein [Histoplasma capsulatum G186AR]
MIPSDDIYNDRKIVIEDSHLPGSPAQPTDDSWGEWDITGTIDPSDDSDGDYTVSSNGGDSVKQQSQQRNISTGEDERLKDLKTRGWHWWKIKQQFPHRKLSALQQQWSSKLRERGEEKVQANHFSEVLEQYLCSVGSDPGRRQLGVDNILLRGALEKLNDQNILTAWLARLWRNVLLTGGLKVRTLLCDSGMLNWSEEAYGLNYKNVMLRTSQQVQSSASGNWHGEW